MKSFAIHNFTAFFLALFPGLPSYLLCDSSNQLVGYPNLLIFWKYLNYLWMRIQKVFLNKRSVFRKLQRNFSRWCFLLIYLKILQFHLSALRLAFFIEVWCFYKFILCDWRSNVCNPRCLNSYTTANNHPVITFVFERNNFLLILMFISHNIIMQTGTRINSILPHFTIIGEVP